MKNPFRDIWLRTHRNYLRQTRKLAYSQNISQARIDFCRLFRVVVSEKSIGHVFSQDQDVVIIPFAEYKRLKNLEREHFRLWKFVPDSG